MRLRALRNDNTYEILNSFLCPMTTKCQRTIRVTVCNNIGSMMVTLLNTVIVPTVLKELPTAARLQIISNYYNSVIILFY